MRADEVLVAHHDVLRGLLRDLAEITDAQIERRERLRDEFLREIEIHAHIEDELFYPAVRDVSPLLSVAHAEHRQIDEQLATVMRMPLDDPEFTTEVRMLENTVRHHTMEEEERIFPQSLALGKERLEQLGAALQDRSACSPVWRDAVDHPVGSGRRSGSSNAGLVTAGRRGGPRPPSAPLVAGVGSSWLPIHSRCAQVMDGDPRLGHVGDVHVHPAAGFLPHAHEHLPRRVHRLAVAGAHRAQGGPSSTP